MVLLMANNLNDFQHEEFHQDTDKIERALVWFQDHFKDKPCKMSDMLGDIFTENIRAMKQRCMGDIGMIVEDDWLGGFIDSGSTMW